MIAGSRILVIDDSTTLRKLVEIAMRGTGCEVDFAANGCDGVSLARTTRPDVILLDYLLPDLGSTEVCQRLSDDDSTARVPVVVMSANQRSVLDDFRDFPTVVDFVGKPFTPKEIRSRLESAIRTATADPRGGGRTQHASLAPQSSGAVARASSQHDPEGSEPAAGLQLRGDLASTPAIEILRLLLATQAVGTLVIDLPAIARVYLRRGELLMCSTARVDAESVGHPISPEIMARAHRDQAAGKPALVTFAEAGLVRVTDLPVQLHALGGRVLGELLDARAGRFEWKPSLTLPDFVEAFGRPLSVTAIALEQHRKATTSADASMMALDDVYDRTPRFSAKLAGARLSADEQRILALIDGRHTVRDVLFRSEISSERASAIFARLRDVDLIRDERTSGIAEGCGGLAILDPDRDDFCLAIRAHLGRRPQPIEVLELAAHPHLAQAVLKVRPRVVLLNTSLLTDDVIAHELPLLAREGTITLVGVLEAPDPDAAVRMLDAGLHEVLIKPIHISDIDRLMSTPHAS